MSEHRLGPVEEFPEGEAVSVTVEGLAIAVVNVEGEYYALQDYCLHQGGRLSEATDEKINLENPPGINRERRTIYCPWHFWEWDLETGEFLVNPDRRLRTFEVDARDGAVWITI